MKTNFGIVVPTKDRPEFIFRLFKFYKNQINKPSIYIGDSSNDENSNSIKNEIEKYKKDLNIEYFYNKNFNEREFQKQLLYAVKEDFCAYTADDDLIFTSNINKYIEFLTKNLSYRTCSGSAFIFKTHNNRPYGKINFLERYWKRNIKNSENKIDRLFNFILNYWVTEFSVHRTFEYIEDFDFSEKIKSRHWGEFLTSTFVAVRGKHKIFNEIYLARQVHDNRYIIPKSNKDENFKKSFDEFLKIITKTFENEKDFSKKEFEKAMDKKINERKNKIKKNVNILEKYFVKIKNKLYLYNLITNKEFKILKKIVSDHYL